MADPITIEEAKVKIENAMSKGGAFTHNVISLVLRNVANTHGCDAANSLIDEFDIEHLYGITKQTGSR